MKVAEALNHPVTFLFAITIGVIALQKLMQYGFQMLGWTGPAALVS